MQQRGFGIKRENDNYRKKIPTEIKRNSFQEKIPNLHLLQTNHRRKEIPF